MVCPLRVALTQRRCCSLHVGEEMKRSVLLLSVQRYVAMAHLLPVRRTQDTLFKLWQWCFFQSCYCVFLFYSFLSLASLSNILCWVRQLEFAIRATVENIGDYIGELMSNCCIQSFRPSQCFAVDILKCQFRGRCTSFHYEEGDKAS